MKSGDSAVWPALTNWIISRKTMEAGTTISIKRGVVRMCWPGGEEAGFVVHVWTTGAVMDTYDSNSYIVYFCWKVGVL